MEISRKNIAGGVLLTVASSAGTASLAVNPITANRTSQGRVATELSYKKLGFKMTKSGQSSLL